MSLAPGPGDLGGTLPSREPCFTCDGVDTDHLCSDCSALVGDPISAVRLLRETEHALGACESALHRARRRRDEARAGMVVGAQRMRR